MISFSYALACAEPGGYGFVISCGFFGTARPEGSLRTSVPNAQDRPRRQVTATTIAPHLPTTADDGLGG
jgi:hypothetical protein